MKPRYVDALDFIIRYRHKSGLAPTLQEIADGLGITRSSVFDHVVRLEQRGMIKRGPKHSSRSIELAIPWQSERRRCVFPLVGTIDCRD